LCPSNPTDVLFLELDQLGLPGGKWALPVSDARLASLPSLWSFAELLRLSAAAELDVDIRELEAGLQPYPLSEGSSRWVFLADRLDNGAGYAHRVGEPELLAAVLDRIVDDLGASFEGGIHGETCDSACPDCLRSCDNRSLHRFLIGGSASTSLNLLRVGNCAMSGGFGLAS